VVTRPGRQKPRYATFSSYATHSAKLIVLDLIILVIILLMMIGSYKIPTVKFQLSGYFLIASVISLHSYDYIITLEVKDIDACVGMSKLGTQKLKIHKEVFAKSECR
jgi:hypothetical protein